ncbi:hypothetical protein GE061_012973 [Apolygus lucorum]|uniref:Uncharacterized protein n=1 Tax=Apolygus lucorum TaxID=248454 RepID=A0A8S9XTU0_APOLU|nr:hypothetical protein GE061_012973 [Apolygus lucorum]
MRKERERKSVFLDIRSPSYRRIARYKQPQYDEKASDIAREKRMKEILNWEKRILRSRRREQLRRLPPRQLELIEQLPHIASSSSSSSLGLEQRSRRKTSILSEDDGQISNVDVSIDTLGSRDYGIASYSDIGSSSSIPIMGIRKSIKIQEGPPIESISLEENQVETWREHSLDHQTKQYRALMRNVRKHVKHSPKIFPDPFRKGWFEPEGAMDESFQQLRQDIGDSIPWPDPVFFETNFSLHRDPHWIVIEIKELVTIPLEFAEKENAFEMTQAAALVRMAAKTNIRRILHLGSLKFFESKLATKTVPEYLVKNKFIENLSLPDLPPKLSRISRRQTAFTRKSIVSIIDKLCPEFLKRMSHYS